MVQHLKQYFTIYISILIFTGIILHISILFSIRYGFLDNFFVYSHENKNPDNSKQTVDFSNYYKAAYCLAKGLNFYDNNLDFSRLKKNYQASPIKYAPITAVFLLPLILLDFKYAYIFWIILSELLFFLSILLLIKLSKNKKKSLLIIAIYLWSTIIYVGYYDGQMNQIISFLIILMFYGLIQNRVYLFKLSWFLSLAYKHFTIILFPLFLIRKEKLFYFGSLLIVLLSIFLYPYSPIKEFSFNFDLSKGEIFVSNFSLFSLLNLIFKNITIIGFKVGTIFFLLIHILIAAKLFKTIKAYQKDTWYILLLLICYFFILYHRIWTHHMIMLLPVFSILILLLRNNKLILKILILTFLIILPNLFFLTVYYNIPPDNYYLSIILVGQRQIAILLLFFFILNNKKKLHLKELNLPKTFKG